MALLSGSQKEEIVAAIRDAELRNRGEVRVHIERWCFVGGPMARAEALFHKLGMGATKDGTGVVLYVAARSRRAAVFAGPGVFGDAAAGQWTGVVAAVAEGYRDKAGIRGIVEAIGRIGAVLREAVPGEDETGNELPDEVTVG